MNQYLIGSKVRRSGATSRHWDNATHEVRVYSEDNALVVRFDIASKGGGTTELEVMIYPCDFDKLLEGMMRASPQSAAKLMAAELARHLSAPATDAL